MAFKLFGGHRNVPEEEQPEQIIAKLRQVDVLVSQAMSVAEAVRSISVTQTEQALGMIRRIDKQFPETPFFGVRQITWHLRNDGQLVKLTFNNIFIEMLWRTLTYECVRLHAWETGSETKAAIRKWMTFYNHQRPHSSLGGKPLALIYWPRNDSDQPD
jgi:putative transposase